MYKNMNDLPSFISDISVVLAVAVGGVSVTVIGYKLWGQVTYKQIINSHKTNCDIDTFVTNELASNPVKAGKVSFFHKLRLGNRVPSTTPIELELIDSPHVPGLKVSRRLNSTDDGVKATPLKHFLEEQKQKNQRPVVVATIRMGFGHHRIAYSSVSWALSQGYPTIFHDLLNIQSPEADLLVSTDDLYSKFSRIASEMGGVVEKFWGQMLLTGDPDALRAAYLTAVHLRPLLLSYPLDTPIISTHQLVTLTASAIGFTKVVNLVVDNFAQWFLVVPRTLNLVQGPVNYQNFLKMGVTSKELQYTGHWNPKDLVQNIDVDCQRRIARAKIGLDGDGQTTKIVPRRLLIPVGGAGAQRKFIMNMIEALTPLVLDGKVQLFLNAGDHQHMKDAFIKVLDSCSLTYETVTTLDGVHAVQQKLIKEDIEKCTYTTNVTLFTFEDYFPAVATTDIMCRGVDILCCKPSELAFYALPKLHIRRVGDHEGFSAIRASELGDGTIEAREMEDVMIFMDLFLKAPDLLIQMNQAVIDNNKIGIYNGCKKAVETVVAMK